MFSDLKDSKDWFKLDFLEGIKLQSDPKVSFKVVFNFIRSYTNNKNKLVCWDLCSLLSNGIMLNWIEISILSGSKELIKNMYIRIIV